MRCEEIMKKDVECVSPQDTVQAAAKRMRDENIGFLPVCDQSKKVQGTITDRDLAIRVLADGRQATTPVKDVMTREVVAVRPDEDLRKAEELMSKNHKSRIMCVDQGGKLVGVISLSDIAQREEPGRAAQTLRNVSEREARA
ncbi:MAG TPA: CBS domain-containing protein [Myxococcaceae bacterium]|jgi:CBS domain-containing protein|nr:CBS domain-containing protein [Myxococcaceae bacterium]HZA50199.1 CBS domain-containing protein [Myxococcaceae bacterium]